MPDRRRIKILYFDPKIFFELMTIRRTNADCMQFPLIDLPEGFKVINWFASPERMCFGFIIEHPSFPEVPFSDYPPSLYPEQTVSIKRKTFCNYCYRPIDPASRCVHCDNAGTTEVPIICYQAGLLDVQCPTCKAHLTVEAEKYITKIAICPNCIYYFRIYFGDNAILRVEELHNYKKSEYTDLLKPRLNV